MAADDCEHPSLSIGYQTSHRAIGELLTHDFVSNVE
jgi:hypothetical protein